MDKGQLKETRNERGEAGTLAQNYIGQAKEI